MKEWIQYTGGELQTNAYFLKSEKGYLCFDAPGGIVKEIERLDIEIEALVLTHGHFDHTWEAALMQKTLGCPIYIHPIDRPMLEDPSIFRNYGIELETDGLTNILSIDLPDRGEGIFSIGGHEFKTYHIPGHSPGSVAFYLESRGVLIGGDILFAGGIGRYDFPQGSLEDLLFGIRKHLFPLPQETKLYTGHGEDTTLKKEKAENMYLQEL